jgi:hypothetical protein
MVRMPVAYPDTITPAKATSAAASPARKFHCHLLQGRRGVGQRRRERGDFRSRLRYPPAMTMVVRSNQSRKKTKNAGRQA